MDNLDRTEITAQDLHGPELHYMGITKAIAAESFNKRGVTLEKAQGLYARYNTLIQKVYAERTDPLKQLRPAGQEEPAVDTSAAAARQVLENLQFDQEGFNKICAEVGIDDDVVAGLFEDYQAQTIAATESVVQTREAVEAEVETQEAETEEEDSLTATTPAEARAFLEGIRNNPKHAYNDDKASSEQHEKAVLVVNRLIAISRNEASNLDGIQEFIDEKYHPKPVDRSSSNNERPSKSLDQPDERVDGIDRGGESSANSEEGQFPESED